MVNGLARFPSARRREGRCRGRDRMPAYFFFAVFAAGFFAAAFFAAGFFAAAFFAAAMADFSLIKGHENERSRDSCDLQRWVKWQCKA